jgi:hypothetical protein
MVWIVHAHDFACLRHAQGLILSNHEVVLAHLMKR